MHERARPRATLALVLGLGMGLWLAACERFDDAPRETARRFWDALLDGDLEAAGALATASDQRALRELAGELEIAEIDFGQTLRNESTALVETSVVIEPRDRTLVFHTYLSQLAGDWKVDARRSRRELTRAALAASVEEMKESLSGGAEALVEEFERRALGASEALREAVEEFERALRGAPSP